MHGFTRIATRVHVRQQIAKVLVLLKKGTQDAIATFVVQSGVGYAMQITLLMSHVMSISGGCAKTAKQTSVLRI
jgi:hypothetical protein